MTWVTLPCVGVVERGDWGRVDATGGGWVILYVLSVSSSRALAARTTWKTIPQVFVGNEFVGGATDTFDAWKSGKLPELLAKHGVAHKGELAGNPYAFLPNWLQPR